MKREGLSLAEGWRGRVYHLRWIDEGRGLTLKSLPGLCIFLGETTSDLRTALSPKLCSEFCLLQRSPGSVLKAFLHFLQSPDENFPGLPYMPRAPVKACVFGCLCLETKPLVDLPWSIFCHVFPWQLGDALVERCRSVHNDGPTALSWRWIILHSVCVLRWCVLDYCRFPCRTFYTYAPHSWSHFSIIPLSLVAPSKRVILKCSCREYFWPHTLNISPNYLRSKCGFNSL